MTTKIAYFAHDLADPAVHRRVRMFAAGGAVVAPIGFRRGPNPIARLAGFPTVEIGRSTDGRLLERAQQVALAWARLKRLARHLRGTHVIVARNIEMLVLAAHAQRRHVPAARLVYECLDIHRILLSKRLDGALLRSLESRLWRDVDLLLTSSPGFVRNYFEPRGFPAPVKIVENKVLLLDEICPSTTAARPPLGPPWRIGWFGMLRCRRSLQVLCALAQRMKGAVEVVIRGRPSSASLPDFERTVAGRPQVHYAGPYQNPADLPAIYADVHFVWAIDYYESGQNSAWLLPNRLYEGALYGAVPIALSGVETSAWLAKRAAGVALCEPLSDSLLDFFQRLDESTYAKLVGAVRALPRTDLISDRTDCCAMMEALCCAREEHGQSWQPDNAKDVAFAQEKTCLGARP